MISASAGSYELVEFFLEHGCNPNSENESKQRALHYAASKNFPKVKPVFIFSILIFIWAFFFRI